MHVAAGTVPGMDKAFEWGLVAMEDDIEKARELLANASRVLVGAGAGLSTAAGLSYSGERFIENFNAYIKRYHMTDMYSAGFYPFDSDEARWGYWSRHVWLNRFDPAPLPLYRDLNTWLEGRDYFVITTNVDAQFENAGMPAAALFEPQGDYGYMQCQSGCHQVIYPLDKLVARMVEQCDPDTLCIPSELVPKCPVCGGPMVVHVRVDGNFVQDESWYAAARRYEEFTQDINDGNTLLLELGVGWNTPVWIRFPFERFARENGCPLLRMNYDDARVDGCGEKSAGIEGDLAKTWQIVA